MESSIRQVLNEEWPRLRGKRLEFYVQYLEGVGVDPELARRRIRYLKAKAVRTRLRNSVYN